MRRILVALALVAVVRLAVADPFLDAVVSSTVGQGGGGRAADLPGVVLGPPRGGGAFTGSLDTFSLGLGGQIVVAFTDNVVVTTSVRAAVPTKQTSNPSQYPVQQQGVSFKWSVG